MAAQIPPSTHCEALGIAHGRTVPWCRPSDIHIAPDPGPSTILPSFDQGWTTCLSARLAVDEFSGDIHMAEVTSDLFEQVSQDPAESGRPDLPT